MQSGLNGTIEAGNTKHTIPLSGETLSGKIFFGRNFRHQTKSSSLSPYEKFRPRKVKVSLVEVQVNLRGKQAI